MTPRTTVSIALFTVLTGSVVAGCSLLSVTIGNAIRNSKPAPVATNRSINRQRTNLVRNMEAELRAVEVGTDFVRYATATDDRCYKGENNWKVQTGYAHRCTIRLTRLYGLRGNFRGNMISLESRLSASDWMLPEANVTEMLTGYYDRFCAHHTLQVFGTVSGPAPGCSLSDFARPQERYTKKTLELFISFAEKGVTDLRSLDNVQYIYLATGDTTYARHDLQDVPRAFNALTATYPYVVSVSVQSTYFEN